MNLKQFKFHELVSKTPNIRGIPTNEYKEQGRFPVIDQGNKFIAGYSDNEHALYKDTLPVVVFGDHTLAIKYLDFPFCVGADGTQLLKPNTDVIIGKFLYFAIINLNIQSLGYSRHFKVLKKSIFYVPDIEEQHRIVKILDLAQSLIEKRKQAIVYLDDYIKAVFLDMFGDPVSNPKGWEIIKLEHLLNFITSGSRGWAKYFSANGEYFLSIKNVGRDNRLHLNNVVYVNPPKNAEARRTMVQKGDVLFSITADLGRTIVIPKLEKNAFINQHLAILRLKKEVDPIYLAHYLSSQGGQQQLKNLNKGSAKAGLNFNDIKSLNILLPSVQLQIKFASIVNQTELLHEKMLYQLEELEDNFHAQLQRAFRGD